MKKQHSKNHLNLAFAATLFVTGALVACNDKTTDNTDDTDTDTNGDGDGDGDEGTGGNSSGGSLGEGGVGEGGVSATGGDSGVPTLPPIYALTARVYGEIEDQSYVLLTDTLATDTRLNLDDAVLEIPGLALGTGPEGEGALYVASDLAPTVTRYELTSKGALKEGKSVSFLNEGITYIGEYAGQFQYIDDHKAYWFAGPSAQVVVWDPTDMSVTDTISLTSLAHAGEALTFSASPLRKGNMLYTFAAWHTPPPALNVVSRTAVIAINTTTDVATIVEDSRCGYVRDGVFGEDGLLYIATEGFGTAVNYLNDENGPAPCLLRFDTEDNTFDNDYKVTLSDLFGGDPAGSLLVGPGNQAFLRVLDASALPDGVADPRPVGGSSAWSWAKLAPGDTPTVELIEGPPLSSGRVVPVTMGGKVYTPRFVDDERTIFTELTDNGPSAEALEIPGLVFSAVKLQ